MRAQAVGMSGAPSGSWQLWSEDNGWCGYEGRDRIPQGAAQVRSCSFSDTDTEGSVCAIAVVTWSRVRK